MFFYHFSQKIYEEESYRSDWVKKQDTMSGTFNLLSLVFLKKYIIDSWFVFIMHIVDFFQFLPQAAVNHIEVAAPITPAAIVFRKSRTAQNWNISIQSEFKNASTLGKNRERVHSKFDA